MERILCAANFYQDGKVRTFRPKNINEGLIICGHRHHNCIQSFAELVGFPYSKAGHILHRTEKQGFLTSENRWVDRKEALKIAYAANQVTHKVPLDFGVGLTSEDLY